MSTLYDQNILTDRKIGHEKYLKKVDITDHLAAHRYDWYPLSEAFIERHQLEYLLVHAAVLDL